MRGHDDRWQRRIADFGTHRALHRCLRIGRTGVGALLIANDCDGRHRHRSCVAITPAQGALTGLVPTVLPG